MEHYYRRSGPRRNGVPQEPAEHLNGSAADGAPAGERRRTDRRKRNPGLAALLGAILGYQQPEPNGKSAAR